MTRSGGNAALAEWAKGLGLEYAETARLPDQTDVLSRRGKVEGAVSGTLPGGLEGTLLFYTYTWTDGDGDRHERPFTLVVTRIPESIGFAPYLSFSGRESDLNAGLRSLAGMRKLDLGDTEGLKGSRAYVFKGTNESWLMQLFSPALVDWLARSDDAFGFELAGGVLVAGLDRHRGGKFLQTLCEDAAHIAGAIRAESIEEAETGGAEAEAAKDLEAADPRMNRVLGSVAVGSPASPDAARAQFRSHLRRSPRVYIEALGTALAMTAVLNIPGIALPIVLIVNGAYALLAGIELAIVAIVFFFAFRGNVRDNSTKYAEEAFYRAYAADRRLKLGEPLKFAATHAEAKLPFKPDRVFSGELPGGLEAALALSGDGSKRDDRIAVVAGPAGPVAEAELRADPPPVSAKTLDSYAERLSAELKAATATATA